MTAFGGSSKAMTRANVLFPKGSSGGGRVICRTVLRMHKKGVTTARAPISMQPGHLGRPG